MKALRIPLVGFVVGAIAATTIVGIVAGRVVPASDAATNSGPPALARVRDVPVVGLSALQRVIDHADEVVRRIGGPGLLLDHHAGVLGRARYGLCLHMDSDQRYEATGRAKSRAA